MPFEEAAQYEKPFEYVRTHVLPAREKRRDDYREMWWQYARPHPEMRSALQGKARYIATPRVSKHRLFTWLNASVLANDGTIIFSRDDDVFFGILHSRIQEVWARVKVRNCEKPRADAATREWRLLSGRNPNPNFFSEAKFGDQQPLTKKFRIA